MIQNNTGKSSKKLKKVSDKHNWGNMHKKAILLKQRNAFSYFNCQIITITSNKRSRENMRHIPNSAIFPLWYPSIRFQSAKACSILLQINKT